MIDLAPVELAQADSEDSLVLAPAARAPARDIAVYEVVRAAHPAIWINNLLRPVLAAIRAEGRPIELRPMWWSGLSAGADKKRNPDGRIKLSLKVSFYSRTSFLCTYIHELSHCLLEECEPDVHHQHNSCFYSLNLALFMRLDAIKFMADDVATSFADVMDGYDLQNSPESWEDEPIQVWKPRAIGWAMRTAHDLFSADLTAEQLAAAIAKRYAEWCSELASEPPKTAKQQADFAAAKLVAAKKLVFEIQEKADLKEKLQIFQWLAGYFGFAFLGVFYFLLSR